MICAGADGGRKHSAQAIGLPMLSRCRRRQAGWCYAVAGDGRLTGAAQLQARSGRRSCAIEGEGRPAGAAQLQARAGCRCCAVAGDGRPASAAQL